METTSVKVMNNIGLCFTIFMMGAAGMPGQVVRPMYTSEPGLPNLPAQRIGANDLIAISVYDAPELTRTVRVGEDGYFRLPMLKQKILAAGLMPAALEAAIVRALESEQLMVDPFVTVTIAEYESRPI